MIDEMMDTEEHNKQIDHILRMFFGKYEESHGHIKCFNDLEGQPFMFYFQFNSSAFGGTITGAEKYVEKDDLRKDLQGGICLKIYVSVPEAMDRKIRCIIWHWDLECWAVWFEDCKFPIKEKHGGMFRLVEEG